MKIIDEKGRVFGLINIIDLVVIILVVSLVPLMFNLGEAIFKKKALEEEQLSVKIKFLGIDPDFVDVIKNGDIEKDFSGKKIGEIAEVVSTVPSKEWVVVDNKTLAAIDNPVKRDVIVKAKILCIKKGGAPYYKAAQAKIGSNIIFSTDTYLLTGLIVGLDTTKKA